MKCLICDKINIDLIGEYKLEIESDKQYFKKCKIYKCNDCDFSFVNPMPQKKDLNYFYENVYRSLNRPPYWLTENYKDLKNFYLEDKNLNYLLYSTLLIDFKKIKSIYDFGGGYGDLGFSLKQKFPHLELYCTENDKQCLKILNERGYKNIQNYSELENKFDLIITLHSLEHLDSPEVFKDFRKVLKPNGMILFEVPNCTKEYFNGRPYDSPHLLFFTKKSFEKISKKYQFSIDNFTFASYSFEEDHKNQRDSQNLYNEINQKQLNLEKIKKILKKIISYNLIRLRQKFIKVSKATSNIRINSFAANTGNNCYIRGILRKLN